MSVVFGLADSAISQPSIGARSVATGQTGVSVPGDQWAIFSNISLLQTNDKQVSFYGFRYAGIIEITDAAVSGSIPLGNGALGAGIHRYGFHLFNETRYRAGYKYNWQQFHAGAVLTYHFIQQGGGYGSAGAMGADLGIGGQIAKPLWFGLRATNVNQPTYGNTDEALPRELAAGLTYFPSPGVMITAESVKDVRFPISIRTGVDAELITGLKARAGVTTNPETYSGGFGYSTRRWQVNIAVQQHWQLGLSPAFDIGILL